MIEILFFITIESIIGLESWTLYIIKCNNRFCTRNQVNWRKIAFIAKNECVRNNSSDGVWCMIAFVRKIYTRKRQKRQKRGMRVKNKTEREMEQSIKIGGADTMA